MARFQALRRLILALALILSGTHTALGQPSTMPPPQTTAPQAITGPFRMIVIDPQPVAENSPDFRLFGHSFRALLSAAPAPSDRLNVLRQLPAPATARGETVVDPRWPDRVNPVAKSGMTWSIHSLSELGQDAEHGKWLAETIAQVVQPHSWTVVNGQKATITYQPQGKALIVYNTPEVQEEVTAFLSQLRQATTHHTPVPAAFPPSEKTIIPASFNMGLSAHTTASAGTKGWVVPYGGARQPVGAPPEYAHGRAGSAHPASPYGGYPVPSVRQPKHLFHFIIRYEGEGIIDSNVVDMLKIYNAKKDEDKDAEKGAADAEEQKMAGKGQNLEVEGAKAKAAEKEQAKVKWRTDYTAARQEAKEKKLPIVIMFCKDDCSMCVKMDKTTFQDALVIGVLNDKFIPVKVEGDELATAFKIEAYPSFVFAASDGRVMQQQVWTGYKDATAFFDELLKALDQRHLPDLPLQNVQPAQLLTPPPTVPSLQELPPPAPPSRDDK